MRAAFLTRFFQLALGVSVACGLLTAQTRVNDKDLEALMRNLRDDAKAFRDPFASALKKSTIRKTSRERDLRNLSELFAKQSEALLNNFKQTRNGDANLTAVANSSQQLSAAVANYGLGSQVTGKWSRIQNELGQIFSAYNMSLGTPAVSGSSVGVAGGEVSCLVGVGRERAERLAQECTQVSPATHPPCNIANACSLIIDEIKRGCALIDARDRPAFCGEYGQGKY